MQFGYELSVMNFIVSQITHCYVEIIAFDNFDCGILPGVASYLWHLWDFLLFMLSTNFS